jgi:hypothetical protein
MDGFDSSHIFKGISLSVYRFLWESGVMVPTV